MARAMFEYTKTILKKVSFSCELFSRELKKASKRLLPYEIEELNIWLTQFTKDQPHLSKCVKLVKVSKPHPFVVD